MMHVNVPTCFRSVDPPEVELANKALRPIVLNAFRPCRSASFKGIHGNLTRRPFDECLASHVNFIGSANPLAVIVLRAIAIADIAVNDRRLLEMAPCIKECSVFL